MSSSSTTTLSAPASSRFLPAPADPERVPAQGAPRVRWLWGAFEHLRQHLVRHLPEDAWQQVDTTALPGPEGTPALRNGIETTNGELTRRLGLARCQDLSGELLTRTAATVLAHTLQLLGLVRANELT